MTSLVYEALPTERIFPDCEAHIAIKEELVRCSASRALILSSASIAASGGPVSVVEMSLGKRCVGVGTSLSRHTPIDAVIEMADLARSTDADLLVAIGGGSVIDGAKAVKAALSEGLKNAQSFRNYSVRDEETPRLTPGGPPILAIPTTLSAAEFTSIAGYTDAETGLKDGVRAPHLAATAIALDPDMALHTPISLWLASGCRSIDHAVEGIFSARISPALSRQALAGLRMLAEGLRAARQDPESRDARRDCQQAVWLISDCCIHLTMGASHGLGYLLGTVAQVDHGTTSAVLLPTVVDWNAEAFPEQAQMVADALDSETASGGLRALFSDLSMPCSISNLTSKREIIDEISRLATHHPVVAANARPFANEAEIRSLLDSAW